MVSRSLPPIQTGPTVWYGSEMATKQREWLTDLTSREIQELEEAGEKLLKQDVNLGAISKTQFELPTLGPKLVAMKGELINGRGFAVSARIIWF